MFNQPPGQGSVIDVSARSKPRGSQGFLRGPSLQEQGSPLFDHTVIRGIFHALKEMAPCQRDMTPTSYCYFDYYQSRDHATEPRAIGGFLPLEKV